MFAQVWGFDKFQQVLSSEHGLPSDWVQGTLRVSLTVITVKMCVLFHTYVLQCPNKLCAPAI